MNKTKTGIYKLAIISYIIIPISLFLSANKLALDTLIFQMAQIFAVLGISLLVLQLILSSRFKPFEKGVGHNVIMQWHALSGKSALTLLLLHPILINWDLIRNGIKLLEIPKTYTIAHWVGATALTLLVATVFFAVYSERLKINYEIWKILHKGVYAVVILGFIHSFALGSDIILRDGIFYWWLFLIVVASAAFIYRNIIRAAILEGNYYEVADVKKEAPGVRSIYLSRLKGKNFNYLPGQFAYTLITAKGLPKEEHHFTISSSPEDEHLAFTIKSSGDYTSLLGSVSKGDKIRLEGPFGVFTNVGEIPPFVFIAGGIGITPLMSMLRYARKYGSLHDYFLIYSAKNQKELIFRDELEEMNKEGLKISYVLSQEKKKNYNFGRIDESLLRKLMKGRKNAKVYLVGPFKMMDSVIDILVKLGMNKSKIFTERFALK